MYRTCKCSRYFLRYTQQHVFKSNCGRKLNVYNCEIVCFLSPKNLYTSYFCMALLWNYTHHFNSLERVNIKSYNVHIFYILEMELPIKCCDYSVFFKQNINRAYCWQIIAFFYMFDWCFLGWGWDAIKTDYSLLAWGHITYTSNTCITSLALFICLTICFVVYK